MKNLILSLSFIFAFCLFNPGTSAFAEDKIVAIINNDIITQKDLNDFINFTRMQLSQEFRGKQLEDKIQSIKLDLINRLIEDRLILQEARRLGANIDDSRIKARLDEIRKSYRSFSEFQEALSQQGLVQSDLEQKIREQFLIYSMIEFEVKRKVNVSPAEVTKFYQDNTQDFKVEEERDFESINIDSESRAREIYDNLKRGVAIEDLMKRYPEASFNRLSAVKSSGELKKHIEDAVFSLKKGEFSEPVKIDNNYYIFRVQNILPPRQQNLSEARDKVYAYLFNKKLQQSMDTWLEGLRKRSYIKICQ